MENSPFFDGIREEWEARGELKGEFKGKLEALLDVAEIKFGSVPDGLRTRLGELQTHKEIRQAMREAMSAGTIEEYIAKFKL